MKTVLFIEDNAEIRENMGEILELASYKVLLAENGKRGVELALEQAPDIIVCDIMMPELDGYGVIHLLQKHDSTRHIPFIFLTAKSERAELRRGMELGADDYITKPFSGTELLNAIESRLRKSVVQKSAPSEPMEALAQIVQQNGGRSLQQAFEEDQESLVFARKERIYTEGHKAYRLFCVMEGKVKIYRSNDEGKDLITDICGAGDFFGYTALLEEGMYTETAEALERSRIASITHETFEELMHNNPEVTQQFVRLLAGNLREKEEQLLGIAYNSLRRKVAQALLRLHKKYQPEGEPPLAFHISRDNLAAIAGTAKESLIRTLSDFRNEGLIALLGTDIMILQEKKLGELMN